MEQNSQSKLYKDYLPVRCGNSDEIFEITADDEYVLSITAVSDKLSGMQDAAPNRCTELCKEQLKEYFTGMRRVFNFPYRLTGTDFQNAIWSEIAKVPYGKTISYKELAERAGCTSGVRAAANAAGANRLLFCVPCHRIIGSDGSLTGFSAGIKLKEYLLNLEKEPAVYTKYNYYEKQKERGIDRSNVITGRFIYDTGDILFETEPDSVIKEHKTYVFPVSFDVGGCSGFTVKCFSEAEETPPDPAYATGAYTAFGQVTHGPGHEFITVTMFNVSNSFVSRAPVSPGENTINFDINEMNFTHVSKISVVSDVPLRNIQIYGLNVYDQYFRYKGQSRFYGASGCTLSEEGHTLVCKMNGAFEIESPVLPDSSHYACNMLMPRRNTVFMVLKNISTASKLRLYYTTTLHTEYSDDNSVEISISRSPEYRAYYFNLSATPGCEGRLLRFKLVSSGIGEIVIREYSFEEEKPIVKQAGKITSCTAANDMITVKGCIDRELAQAGGTVSIYETDMRDESISPDRKTLLTSAPVKRLCTEGDTEFEISGIPLKGSKITRLSSQFAAYLTQDGETLPIGDRFYIENYMDFENNPYAFTLPGTRVSVTDAPFNAKGDACTDDTDPIQAAIDYVWKQGGGTVVVPGPLPEDRVQKFYGRRYRVTNILMRSRVELHFENDTVLWQSPVYRDYKYVPTYGHDKAVPNVCWTHCLHVANLPTVQCTSCEYVKITGFGKIRSVDTGAEEGVDIGSYSTGCPDRIHQIPIGFYECSHLEFRDFEIVRSNNYHFGLYGCAYVFAANIKMHEVRCVSGDGFGLSKGSHHVILSRNFFQSNDDGVVLSAGYFDPRGLVWWKSSPGKRGGTRHVRIAHSYINSGGGKALAFITWGTNDPDYEMQEISDITAFDNYLICVNPVGAWYDNPYNGKQPFDNSELDDYSPVKSVRILENRYEGSCTFGPILATDVITDCGIYSADDFQNGDFCISRQPNLSNWSYKRNKNRDSVAVHMTDGRPCGVLGHFTEGDVSLYQGLHLKAGEHEGIFELRTGATGVWIFVQDIRTGDMIAQKHVLCENEFAEEDIGFTLTEDADIYIGLRHPADMTSESETTELRRASMRRA